MLLLDEKPAFAITAPMSGIPELPRAGAGAALLGRVLACHRGLGGHSDDLCTGAAQLFVAQLCVDPICLKKADWYGCGTESSSTKSGLERGLHLGCRAWLSWQGCSGSVSTLLRGSIPTSQQVQSSALVALQ